MVPSKKKLQKRQRKNPSQIPESALTPPNPNNERLVFSFHEIDLGGDWSPLKLSNRHIKTLISRLHHLSKLTVQQAFNNKDISRIPLDTAKGMNPSARQRLTNQYASLDTLHELRIDKSNAIRIHGRLDGNIFSIIWWDENHQIFPG